ncbi:MAG: transglutaminase family protein [Rhodobacteraceae bacterium]|nr:transglutaminase family protein [Paracoccaceae bacterium]
MILTVSHVTTYRYDAPVRGAVQSLRLTPSDCDGQTVRRWDLSVDGGLRGGAFRDGAGDRIEGWSVRGPVTSVTVRVAGEVETRDLAGLLRGHRESVPPSAWLRPTPAVRADTALAGLARAAAGRARDALDAAHRLMADIAEAIAWRPGATHAHTTAAEALALGEGVCQDHAHAMIAAAHSLDMPARYVSGYMAAAGDDAPGEAAHAWAELWIPDLGWVGFDPANRTCPDERYIRLGSGRDAQDAAPIRGVARGAAAGETLDVAVAVRSAQQ